MKIEDFMNNEFNPHISHKVVISRIPILNETEHSVTLSIEISDKQQSEISIGTLYTLDWETFDKMLSIALDVLLNLNALICDKLDQTTNLLNSIINGKQRNDYTDALNLVWVLYSDIDTRIKQLIHERLGDMEHLRTVLIALIYKYITENPPPYNLCKFREETIAEYGSGDDRADSDYITIWSGKND